MQIQENVSLADYSTMRLGGEARYLVEITSEDELKAAVVFANKNSLKIHVVGSGSNTIFNDGTFDGVVIVNKINGFIENKVSSDEIEYIVGAGFIWDDLVAKSVELGFFDIAALSMIPGTVGAAPVQNIGAYGQQTSDSLITVRAYDKEKGDFEEIEAKDCRFSYRHSKFNTTEKDRFIITAVKMRLHRKTIKPPFYADIETYFSLNKIDKETITPHDLRKAVMAIRAIKLPDPSVVANCGSFFGNPIVSQSEFDTLITKFPELKCHSNDDGNLKLYAGQLIELAGLKDFHDSKTGMATWKNQALVVVN
jgi:UDP-N-acetylmuramate dehydrogenase